MIIQNGNIEPVIVTDGGYDPTSGYPLDETVTYGAKVPCQYILNNSRQMMLANGERLETEGYQILIEQQPQGFTKPDKVRLSDLSGNDIGVFVVDSMEHLDAVSEIRIIAKVR